MAHDRLPGPFFDGKAQLGGEAQSPKDPEGVLGKAFLRVAHTADHTILQIFLSAKQIHKSSFRMVRHGVDGEISPAEVFPQIRGEGHLARMAAVLVGAVDPIGCHFVGLPVYKDRHGSVLDAGVDGAAENRLHLFRRGGGSDVPVVGCFAQQGVPHTASDNIRFVSGGFEPTDDPYRVIRNIQFPVLIRTDQIILSNSSILYKSVAFNS